MRHPSASSPTSPEESDHAQTDLTHPHGDRRAACRLCRHVGDPASTGALIGSFSANAGKGALIGAGVGALGGYLYDQNRKNRGDY
ncbi:hypothetical protein CCR95_21425 [Thiocystis minor]|nr:hypothetical protein [Thiocystis minor]